MTVSRRIKSDAHVPGEGVNFDGLPSSEVLAERLVQCLLEETSVVVFKERESPWEIPSTSDSADFSTWDEVRYGDPDQPSKKPGTYLSNRLIDMELPVTMIKIALTTPYLKTSEKPLSVLFVADPGSGKSAMISMFTSAKGAAYFGGAVTAWGLYNELSEYLRRKGKVSHILIDDLIPTLSRGKKIRDSFIATLLKLTEEGSTGSYSYDTRDIPKFDPKLSVGLISGVTREYLFKQNKWGTGTEGIRKDFLTTGWLERNIPFTYSYSKDTLREIYERMKISYEMNSPEVKLNLPGKKFHVELPEPYATEAQSAGKTVGETIASNGIRYARDFMEIARAIALIRVLDQGLHRNKIAVTEEDMKLFRSLLKYINLDFTELPHREDKKGETEK